MDGKKLEYRGEDALRGMENLTRNAGEVQRSILREILTRNAGTEYLSKYMSSSEGYCSVDATTYKVRVPVVTYAGVRPYVQRIAINGEDSSILSGSPITEMLISSGTSAGEPKLMPSIAEDLDRRTYLYNLIMPIMNQYVRGLDEGKAMYLLFVKAEMPTPSGLPARPVLTSYYKSHHFRCRARDPFNDLTSPDKAILCTDSRQSMYCQLLAGLVHRRRVLRLGAVFASALLRAISFLESNWRSFCDDIRAGRLISPSSVTDSGCRLAMAGVLASGAAEYPGLADEVEGICRRASWKGIICDLWPRAKYVEAVLTGTMAQYIPALEHYTAGRIPLVCAMYASSECYLGVNLDPMCDPADVAYTLLPNMAYFEFIPLAEKGMLQLPEDEEEAAAVAGDKLVDLVDVKVGCYYEIVVTTFAGLYRYRIGDILQVVGFHNSAPKFRFIRRRNVVLSIDNDKTNEEDLHRSITAAKALLGARDYLLVEYTSYADTSTVPGHYVLFWELASIAAEDDDELAAVLGGGAAAAAPPPALQLLRLREQQLQEEAGRGLPAFHLLLLEECCHVVEDSLDYVYRRCRTLDKSVGPLEIRLLEEGAFDALMDLCVGHGGSINQYKTPRCIESNNYAALELLNSRVVACFFSQREPAWSP